MARTEMRHKLLGRRYLAPPDELDALLGQTIQLDPLVTAVITSSWVEDGWVWVEVDDGSD